MRIMSLDVACHMPAQAVEWYALHGWEVAQHSVRIGRTLVRFVPSVVSYTYHYALAIPTNAIPAVIRWCTAHQIRLVAKNSAQPTQHFPEWGMEAVYFYDGVGNIVEFIGQSDGDMPLVDSFDPSMVHGISEIGLVTNDVVGTATRIKEQLSLPSFHNYSETFHAVGTDEGRIIVVQSGREWFPKTGIAAQPAPVTLTCTHNGHQHSTTWNAMDEA